MDQSGQNPNPNGAHISSSSSNTTQQIVYSEHSRQIMAPLATIARPEPGLLWPSQYSQSYTQTYPGVNVQNFRFMAPYLPGNVPNVREANRANQSLFTPYSSTPFGSHYASQQPLPYNIQANYPFNSYPAPFQTGHASSSGLSTTYPQNQISSSPYYNNGVGSPFTSESSLAGALSHSRAVNHIQNQVTSNNAVSRTLGRVVINDSINPDIGANNRGRLEDAKKGASLKSLDADSINLSILDEVFRDDAWTNEASGRIMQTFLTPGNTTNTTGRKSTPVRVPAPVSSSSVIVPTSSVGFSDSLQANQRASLPTPEPSRIPSTVLDLMQDHIPHTPNNYQPHVVTTPSSGSANRATLARDILRALQPAGIKRKRPVNEDHSSVVVSGKKSKTGGINHPSISDVVISESSIPLTSTPPPNSNGVPVQSLGANFDTAPRVSPVPLMSDPSFNGLPEDEVLEPEPIHTSLTTTKVDREILNAVFEDKMLNRSPNQPDNFATEAKDLPPSGAFDVKFPSPHPLPLKSQLGQPATESNDLLPPSPQSTRSAFGIEVPTLYHIPVDTEIQLDQPLPSTSSVKVRDRTPLFLPSESSSPVRQPSPERTSDDEPLTSKKEVIHIDDDEPSQSVLSTGATRVPSNMRPYVLVPRLRSLFIKGKKTVMSEPTERGRGKRAVESEFSEVRDSRSRLTARRCLWRGCTALLDSTEKLVKHTKVVHGSIAEEGIYKCQWTDCRLGTYFTSEDLKRHLKGHAQLPITCPYKGCAYETKRGDGLANHMATNHNTRRDTLRPLAIPSDRLIPQYVESIQIRPAYYSIPIPVIAKQISRERHYRLGPSIRNQIIGKYKPEIHSLRTIALGRDSSSLMADDYDFQQEESPSRTHSSLRQVSPVVNDIDVLEGSVLDSVVIMESRFDGSPLPETASDANAGSVGPRMLDDGLGIDLGPNILQTAREEHESLEVEGLL